jgi:hypothetical protein
VIDYHLRKLDITRKKTTLYAERDEEKRRNFRQEIEELNGWLGKCLLPFLREGQVVVMDNAAFHKSKRTKKLIESVGCKLVYLPPYSPDLNLIEQQWAVIKRKYRTYKKQGMNHHEAINAAFQ